MLNIKRSIIFGTARMHHIWSDRKFNNLILESLKLGIEKFDVAPMYGGGTTQQRLAKVLVDRNAIINTKTGLNRINLINQNSLLEYWARYFIFKIFKSSFNSEKDLRIINNCLINSFSIFRNLIDIDTLFIHEPPSIEKKQTKELISNILKLLYNFKTNNNFKNIGLAGENVFLYKEFFNLGLIDVVQTSLSNLIKTEDSVVKFCLDNCKSLNLYGTHKVENANLSYKLNKIFEKIDKIPNLSIIISTTNSENLSNRVKEAMKIIPT